MSDSLQPHRLQHARLPCPSSTPKFTQTRVQLVSDTIQTSHPSCSLLLPPSVFPSIRVFSDELALHIRWPKYWSFSTGPSRENSRLISFRILKHGSTPCCPRDLKSLLQHRSSKASILHCSAFFIVQLSHLYRTTRKTRALTRWTFVSKVMSLLFNILS